jgi:hypothetical protein
MVQGIEEQDEEVLQQHKREDIEVPRRVGNCNCSNNIIRAGGEEVIST